MIRAFRPEDAPAVARLLRAVAEDLTVSAAGLLHGLAHAPERARTRWWVAEADGRVVGWARAAFRWTTGTDDVGGLWAAVDPGARRRGIGNALWLPAEEHLLSHGARKLRSPADDDDPAGGAFLRARGFVPGRREVASGLDPKAVAPRDLPEGVRLVPLRDLADRRREVFVVYNAGEADMPADDPITDLRYEEWLDERLGHPDLDHDGSFVALVEGRPAALAFLIVDHESGRAANQLTATLPAYRGQGLATLAKVAAARWAAGHGVRVIYTYNDETNAAMLAINRKLGYQPLVTTTHWVRDETEQRTLNRSRSR